IFLKLKRHPKKISKRNSLLNRKISTPYSWGDFHRAVFAARLQVLIDNCVTYNQYYRCQSLLYRYIDTYGKFKNDGWLFFGNKISITVRALDVRVTEIKKAIG
ncbi:MAG: hypothetical protein AAB789_00450, partial [Patescibacteria group bacterium]